MNVLAIGAHFDDLELGCGGTLARHVARGDTVHALIVTSSGYSTPEGQEVRSSVVAKKEAENAAAILGCSLECFDFPTFEVYNTEVLTSRLLRALQQYNIDAVYTHWIHDVHRDHAETGRATLMAAKHLSRVLMYRSNWHTGAQPFHSNVYSDISTTFAIKMEALACYKSELDRTGAAWRSFCEHRTRFDGLVANVTHAEAFEVVRYRIMD